MLFMDNKDSVFCVHVRPSVHACVARVRQKKKKKKFFLENRKGSDFISNHA